MFEGRRSADVTTSPGRNMAQLGHFQERGPDSKVHGANMGPIWGRQDPGGSHVGPMNFAIWASSSLTHWTLEDLNEILD